MSFIKHIVLLKKELESSGGLEKYTWRTAEAFAKKGCQVTFLSGTKFPRAKDYPHFHFQHVLKKKSFLSYSSIYQYDKNVTRTLETLKPHYIFGFDRNQMQTHYRAGNGVHRAFLDIRKRIDPFFKTMTFPINPLHNLILSIEKKAFENPELKKLYTNSHFVKNQVLEYYNVDPSKLEVIHNGVQWHEMQKDFNFWLEAKSKNLSKLSLHPNQFHFIFIGHGFARKGLGPLLDALEMMREMPFYLSVVGKDKHIEHYKHLAKKKGLSSKVTFFGPRKDIKTFLQIADALVIPSYYDPFANVTVEALAMGVSVISSPYNGGSEVIKEGLGSVLQSLDPDEIKDHLMKAMEKPKTWMRSEIIRERVKHLDFSKQIGTLVNSVLSS